MVHNGRLMGFLTRLCVPVLFITRLCVPVYVYLVPFLPKNADFLEKNPDISKIKGILVLKGIFSQNKYVCVLTYQISSFQHNSIEF